MSTSSAMDTAARFGEIPFVDFTKELVTGVFDSLMEAHIIQMDEYATFINSLTTDLSTYINNTADGVTYDQISEFLLNYELPQIGEAELQAVVDAIAASGESAGAEIPAPSGESKDWVESLITAVAPVAEQLIDKIGAGNQPDLDAVAAFGSAAASGETPEIELPSYAAIHNAVASLIASNKYSLLQTMAKQGMMRLVVSEGEIETKITFSTWESSVSGRENTHRQRNVTKHKTKRHNSGGIMRIFHGRRSKSKHKRRTVTVNTAKSYQRDSSGSRVNIFGRVLVRFKTDYAPLNG